MTKKFQKNQKNEKFTFKKMKNSLKLKILNEKTQKFMKKINPQI